MEGGHPLHVPGIHLGLELQEQLDHLDPFDEGADVKQGPVHVPGQVHLCSVLQKVPGQLHVVLDPDGSLENGVTLVVDGGVDVGPLFRKVFGNLEIKIDT